MNFISTSMLIVSQDGFSPKPPCAARRAAHYRPAAGTTPSFQTAWRSKPMSIRPARCCCSTLAARHNGSGICGRPGQSFWLLTDERTADARHQSTMEYNKETDELNAGNQWMQGNAKGLGRPHRSVHFVKCGVAIAQKNYVPL